MSSVKTSKRKSTSHRLTRDEWLARALDFLTRQGNSRLRIDALVRALNVTKGSFYWHFRNREHFQQCLISYWDEQFTQTVVEQVMVMPDDPAERLWAVMQLVSDHDLARYDLAVRAWTADDVTLLPLVRQVDRTRVRFVRSLFEQLGFTGTQLEMRTRSFVTYVSMESAITIRKSKRERLECFREFHSLITARPH